MLRSASVLSLGLVVLAPAQEPPALTASPTRGEAVRIDGRDDEVFWTRCQVATGFRQTNPEQNVAASQPTEVRVAFDSTALYFFALMRDSQPECIVRQLMRRDLQRPSDRFRVDIDSRNDHRTAVRFEVNAAGIQADALLSKDEIWANWNWNAVWESAVVTHDSGWSAELRIPTSALRFTVSAEPVFGINFQRTISRISEGSGWAITDNISCPYVSRFGHLVGLDGLQPKQPAAFLPYVSLRNAANRYEGGLFRLGDVVWATGLDLVWSPSGAVTLNAAVNPDYGQVEADKVVLNLTTVETYLPEKRPFFMESADLFTTPYELFYSRRVGAPPSLSTPIPDGGSQLHRPAGTALLGAAKLTTQSPNGFRIGLLECAVAESRALVQDSLGARSEPVVQPYTLCQVGRLQKTSANGSAVGAFATALNRDDLRDVYTGGIDWDLGLHDKLWRLQGQVVGSADLADSENGLGGQAKFIRNGDGNWDANIRAFYNAPQLDLNHLGYLNLYDRQGTDANVAVNIPVRGRLRHSYVSSGLSQYWNCSGAPTTSEVRFSSYLEASNVVTALGGTLKLPVYDDRVAGDGGPLVGEHAQVTGNARLDLFGGHPFASFSRVTYSPGSDNGSSWKLDQTFNVRAFHRLCLQLNAVYTEQTQLRRWVSHTADSAGNRADVLGRLDYTNLDLGTECMLMISPRFSIQLNNQLLFGRGSYGDFRLMAGAYGEAPLGGVLPPDSPDFSRTVCNTTLLLRWEWHAGNVVYAAWTQSISAESVPESTLFEQSIDALRTEKSSNTFYAKAVFRFAGGKGERGRGRRHD